MELPINKIILASFAFILTYFKKLVEISIIPVAISIPFLSILPDMLTIMEDVYSSKGVIDITLPENMHIYLLLFIYGYVSLSINAYKLVMKGEESVGFLPTANIGKIFKFLLLSIIVGMATMIPVMLTGIPFVQLIVYFLIIPITLNFINISLGMESKYKWNLTLPVQVNLFFLQAVLPALVGMIFTAIFTALGLSMVFEWVVKAVVFYWTLISLALCYQVINQKS